MLATITLVALVILFTWPWRVEATLKATTTTGDEASSSSSSNVSLAGGLEVVGLALSASAAAILGGPGVAVVHLRQRVMWRRSIARADLDALLDWLDAKEEEKEATSLTSRLARRMRAALVSRTDLAGLPGLGLSIFRSLRDVSLHGAILFGSSDPVVVGKTAAWLYPIAGVLAPFGTLDVKFDWTGRSVLNSDLEIAFRIVPARVALEALRFARHHVRLSPASSTV